MNLEIRTISVDGFELVIEAKHAPSKLHAIIAIHNSQLGPAVGGIRMYPYTTVDAALNDVLRLSRGMSYKNASAQIKAGGGKSVIIGNPRTEKTPELLRAFAEFINSLEGKYYAAEDSGIGVEDMTIINEITPYVVGLSGDKGGIGDPSPFTAHGVFKGMQAVALQLWSTPSLKGRTIAIQGIGHVGAALLDLLFWEGANLIIADVNTELLEKCSRLYGDAITIVSPKEIHAVPCDIFAPCAMGAILTHDSIEELQCDAVAGAANNQLATPEIGLLLHKKNILYAPDFVINSGGIIAACAELYDKPINTRLVRDKVHLVYSRLLELFDYAKRKDIAPSTAADELTESLLFKDSHATTVK